MTRVGINLPGSSLLAHFLFPISQQPYVGPEAEPKQLPQQFNFHLKGEAASTPSRSMSSFLFAPPND